MFYEVKIKNNREIFLRLHIYPGKAWWEDISRGDKKCFKIYLKFKLIAVMLWDEIKKQMVIIFWFR